MPTATDMEHAPATRKSSPDERPEAVAALPAAQRLWLGLAGISGMAGVGGEAMAHHLLQGAPERVVLWMHTGTRLALVHALALVALVLLHSLAPGGRPRRSLTLAGWACCGGLLLFSGGLFALVAGAPPALRFIVPLGGALWIFAWGALATAGFSWRVRP